MHLFYVFILLTGICAYFSLRASKNFHGSSRTVHSWLTFSGSISYIAYYIFIVSAFFYAPWWHVIILYVVGIAANFVIGLVIKDWLMGMISNVLSPIAIVLTILTMYLHMI